MAKTYTATVVGIDFSTYSPKIRGWSKGRKASAVEVSEAVELPEIGTVAAMQSYAAEWLDGVKVAPQIERDAKGVRTHFAGWGGGEFLIVEFRPTASF